MAYVGREHLLSVAKHLGDFIQTPKTFLEFQEPPQFLDSKELREMSQLRADLIKTFAVANVIYEDEEITELPFTHDETDLEILKFEQRRLQE